MLKISEICKAFPEVDIEMYFVKRFEDVLSLIEEEYQIMIILKYKSKKRKIGTKFTSSILNCFTKKEYGKLNHSLIIGIRNFIDDVNGDKE